MNALDELTQSFSRLPGIGKKTASRISHSLLKMDQSFLTLFAHQLLSLHERIKICSICGSYTEQDPCSICTDTMRDQALLCLVEDPRDVQTIEASHEFNGLFHVLGGLISPLDGIGPDQLRIIPLINRIKENKITEVIIATNPTVEGDTTALYIQQILKPFPVSVSRLASGLPVGGDLEYADKLTLARSFKGRTSL
ncbi:MAG TPA: recombination mediator RecR [Treponemataceae bacterium]|jgi:recombination protein RecR|nr:recombination mediator RecR [Treponemataceae bacterium]HOQ93384.1 recombination mediator RecR [Treponemataceae bacterium]HPM06539.1 recombination mediator RecR [Treponemataceae bacterium]HPY53573.1 recombination mediator RecR [Treponemataceae bacterium]HQC27323.1 recombination mediator RecR [Treponemataceae bacterium]